MRERGGGILCVLGVSMYSIYTILPLHMATLALLEAMRDI